MPKLKKPMSFETTFGTYVVDEIIGEGGAGRVFGGMDADNAAVAIKVLAKDRATSDRRGRFKNEVNFLQRNKHHNIVSILDHGISQDGPFYVMRRYDLSLRELMCRGIAPHEVLPLFSQILDGVEAAHLLGVVHRDVKPENILYEGKSKMLAIADFGIARFTEDLIATTVDTAPAQRLANFQYAAPEQRTGGREVSFPTDIYALGLMMNEMFTGTLPLGTDYRLVGAVTEELAFLDPVVSNMLRQNPAERPSSIADVKMQIQRHRSEAVSLQKLGQIDGTVIKMTEVDEPLAVTPPRLVSADWDRGQLTLTLDRPVTTEWIFALHRMRNYTSILGKDPHTFTFSGNQAFASAQEYQAQIMIDNFKSWLPNASRTLREMLEETARKEEAHKKEQLRREWEAEEARLRVMRNLRV